ncbi:MAG: hypothetical protein ABII18_12765 [bacterium]|nr:hypothetical protein [bacterium]MBU1917612.1 hypothetical protein [bacterium]
MGVQKKIFLSLLSLCLLITLAHCGGDAGTRVGNPPSTTSEIFPVSLVIASPLDTTDTGTTTLTSAWLSDPNLMFATLMSSELAEINSILEGDSIEDCVFDFETFFSEMTAAACYGPAVAFENFPNGDNSSGVLFKGDVGIWTVNEGDTDEACAAAQLNTRMLGLSNKTTKMLQAFASMVCVANVAEIDITEDVTLTTDMTSMLDENDMTDHAINSATITLTTDDDTGNTIYHYNLSLTYDTTTVVLNMKHLEVDEDDATYRGLFNYRHNSDTHYFCPDGTTEAGSALYNKTSATNMKTQFDFADYCGLDVNPFSATDLIDDSDVFETNNNPDGWVNDKNKLTVNYNISNRTGVYSYSWQAGHADQNSRVLNVVLTLDEGETLLDGEAFFGFGPDLAAGFSYGQISGFICNWSGPGNSKQLRPFVQYQSIEENADGTFSPVLSNVSYSPQNECAYLNADPMFGNFSYDSNGDGIINTDPNTEVENDLLDVTDANADGYIDEIEDAGIVLPITLTIL